MDDFMETIAIYRGVSFFVSIIVCIVFGFVTKQINEAKGYEGGFAWGFWLGIIGIIVVACRQPNQSNLFKQGSVWNEASRESNAKVILRNGGWQCETCKEINPDYVTTCRCGTSMQQSRRLKTENTTPKLTPADEITRYKKLLDDGAITEEEFAAKKKQLLGL